MQHLKVNTLQMICNILVFTFDQRWSTDVGLDRDCELLQRHRPQRRRVLPHQIWIRRVRRFLTGHPRPLFRLISVFSNKQYNFYN